MLLDLFVWRLATVTLPSQSPGHGTGVYWIAGLVGAVLGSDLLHELMHVFVARSDGINDVGMTLSIYGP